MAPQSFIAGVMMLVVLCARVGAATTIHVPADAGTIQDAINATAVGDTVVVSPGTYVERIAITNAITVVSEQGPDVTTIDGGGSGPVVTLGGTGVLEGFTVRNGYALFNAAGIDVQYGAPSILGNHVVDNQGCSGVGISLDFTAALVQGNLIARNRQTTCSGGTGGGGILVGGAGSARIIDNVIEDNIVTSADGGGIALFAAGTPTISGNVIRRNVASGTNASEGGGISLVNASNALIVQNTIVGNRAEVRGGGIGGGAPSGLLLNNTIAANIAPTGSQVFTNGDNNTRFINNVIVAPGGSVPVACGTVGTGSRPAFDHNDVYAGGTTPYGGSCTDQTGTNGNVSVDPMFVNPGADDYHLAPGSPVIDAGRSPLPALPATDIDGDVRIIDGDGDDVDTVDIGVDEALSPDIPFTMVVRARVAQRAPGRDRFRVTGKFTLAADSDGFDPLLERVALRLSDSRGPFFLERLEPGSFVERGIDRWAFVAPPGKTGIVRVSIRPASPAGTFRLSIRARGLDLANYHPGSIDVLLRLGNDVASVGSQ